MKSKRIKKEREVRDMVKGAKKMNKVRLNFLCLEEEKTLTSMCPED